MPRDGAGNYTLPAGNPVDPGTIISSNWANGTMDDLAQSMSNSLSRDGDGGMRVPLLFDDGDKNAPGIAWNDEPGTGLYRANLNDVRMAVGVNDIMQWTLTTANIWNQTDLVWERILTDGGTAGQVPVDAGTIQGQTLVWDNAGEVWEASTQIQVNSASEIEIGVGTNGDNGLFSMLIGSNDGGTQRQAVISKNTDAADGDFTLRASNSTAARDTIFEASTALETMRITLAGDVGIGVTSPVDARIHLNGAGIRLDSTLAGSSGAPSSPENILSYGAGNNAASLSSIRGFNEFTSNLRSGLAFYTADGTAPVEAMRIDHLGNVGIGTAAPDKKLELALTDGDGISFGDRGQTGAFSIGTETTTLGFTSNSTYITFNSYGDNTGDIKFRANKATGALFAWESINDQEYMRIDSAGRVQIGTTLSAATVLTVNHPTQAQLALTEADVIGLRLQTIGGLGYVDTQGDMLFRTLLTAERMRITSGGDVGIGMTTPPGGGENGTWFLSSGSKQIQRQTVGTALTAQIQFHNGNGLVGQITTSASGTQYATTSDYRLKENVVAITGALDRVALLKPSRFNFIADGPTVKVDGFIAHEAQAVVPEAVTGEKDGEGMQQMDATKLVPLLTAAIQELTARLETLENGPG